MIAAFWAHKVHLTYPLQTALTVMSEIVLCSNPNEIQYSLRRIGCKLVCYYIQSEGTG